MTGADDLPIETRRKMWGWFGPTWPSEVCYDGDRLREEMRKPFPAGESCLWCKEPLDEAAGDAGQALPVYPTGIGHVHKECMLRQVLGPVAHLERQCTCYITDPDTPVPGPAAARPGEAEMTERQEALAVWAWVQAHGVGGW